MHGDWAAVFMLAIYLCSPQIDVVASEKGCIRELAVDHCRVLTTHTSVLLQSFFLREWSLHMSAAQYHLVDIVRLHAWFATVNNAQLTIYTQYTHKYTEDIHHKVQQSPPRGRLLLSSSSFIFENSVHHLQNRQPYSIN